MGSGPPLRVVLALGAAAGAWGFPWHGRDGYVRRDVTPSSVLFPPTNSSATITPNPTGDSGAAQKTISATGECSGTTTYSGSIPSLKSSTITQTVIVGPSTTIQPPTLVTPLPPCETIIQPECPPQSSCIIPPFMPDFPGMPQPSIILITKKTTVYESPSITDPPSFDTLDPKPDPHPTPQPTDPGAEIDQIISHIVSNIQRPPADAGPTPTGSSDGQGGPDKQPDSGDPHGTVPQQDSLLSTVTSPPDAANTISLDDIPITVIDQTIIGIGTHSITVTRNPTAGSDSGDMNNILGPTSTLTISGLPITVAPPVIVGSGTTLVVNPSLLSSYISPSSTSGSSPTWGPGDGNDREDNSSSDNRDQLKQQTSSSQGTAHRVVPRALPFFPDVETLALTAATMMAIGGIWILI